MNGLQLYPIGEGNSTAIAVQIAARSVFEDTGDFPQGVVVSAQSEEVYGIEGTIQLRIADNCVPLPLTFSNTLPPDHVGLQF
jgi:hypothetical protein